MTLLLGSDIEEKVNRCMKGSLGRIGGKVNQLFKYNNCTVEDINIFNLRKQKFGSSFLGKLRYKYDLLEQEVRFWRKGYAAVRDRKCSFFDAHYAFKQIPLHGQFNGILSSNVIEHSYNTILFMLNLHLLGKENAYQFHAIPHYKYTFDKFRKPTPCNHFIQDYVNAIGENENDQHAQDHYDSANKSGFAQEFPRYPGIHCHVFDEYNTRELIEFMFEEVTVDIIKTREFSDILVLFKNKLNPQFKKKYYKYFQENQ